MGGFGEPEEVVGRVVEFEGFGRVAWRRERRGAFEVAFDDALSGSLDDSVDGADAGVAVADDLDAVLAGEPVVGFGGADELVVVVDVDERPVVRQVADR